MPVVACEPCRKIVCALQLTTRPLTVAKLQTVADMRCHAVPLRVVPCYAVCTGGGHASLASEQQYLFLSHRSSKPLLVGQYVVVIQADMGQPLVSVEVRGCVWLALRVECVLGYGGGAGVWQGCVGLSLVHPVLSCLLWCVSMSVMSVTHVRQ